MCLSSQLVSGVLDSFSLEAELELARPERSNKEIDAAGESLRQGVLLGGKTSPELIMVSEWRSSHEVAMKRVMTSLKKHAYQRGTSAVIYGRAKRLNSLALKLQRFPKMSLSKMQDIAGCRVVLESVFHAESFAASIRNDLAQKLSLGGEIGEKNYIQSPKEDGYRSLHFIVRYQSPNTPSQKDRRVEIQVRSSLQHQWATALETVDLFHSQSLKTGGGDPRWRRFFALAAGAFASMESRPPVPGLPLTHKHLLAELNLLATELHVAKRLKGWSDVMQSVLDMTPGSLEGVYSYLVELHVDENTTSVKKYDANHLQAAHDMYLQSELRNANSSTRSSVLAKAYSIGEVRAAFPGYYGDTRAFLDALSLS